MLRARCQYCQETIYIDQETGHKFNSESAATPHTCNIRVKVATDTIYISGKPFNLGFSADYREDRKAQLIVDACLKVGLDPDKVRTYRRGDYVYIQT